MTGLAMTTFGVGFGNFFGGSLIKLVNSDVPSIALSATSGFFSKSLPFAAKLGWFGKLFLSYGFLAYLAVAIALAASYILNHTRIGLHLRAVGENPSTADAAGINVAKYKYVTTCIGCMIAGLGGLYYVMDYACGVWSNDAFGDRGWLAIALVIFTIWRPNLSVLASFLFGGLYILYLYIPTGMDHMEYQELYKMIPYVVTLVVLVVTSIRSKRESQPPASLGLAYFRDNRIENEMRSGRMNEKTYILTQILEDDYGCEERPAGQAVTVLALLTDSEGNETVLRQEDQWLYDLQIEEGDTVVVLEGRLYKRKLK